MEIKASQRRTPARSARPLHERLARRHLQQQRLLHGGVLALASSLIAWLLGLPLPLHLALVGLAFVAGSFWRFRSAPRRARRWAFSWIESRSGLGYLTATELPEGDPYGLGAAVRARAAKVNPDAPPLQPWFLPLIVTALMLALVPHLALPTLRAPFAPPVQPNEATPPPPEESALGLEDDATTQDATTTETATPPETGLPAEPEAARTPDAERSFDTAGSADEELGEAQGEQAALNRFLEETEAAEGGGARTQQGPAGTAAPTQSAQSGSQSPRQGGTQGSGEGQQSAQGTPQEDAETAAGENTRPQQEGGTASEGEASSGQNQNPSEAEQEGQAGQERGDAGLSDIGPDDAAENTGEEERTASEGPEAPQEEPNTGETQQAESAQQQQNEQQTGQQESPASTGAPAAQGSTSESDPAARDLREGQSSQRAGSRPGAEVESSRERLGESSSTPERIPGIRGAGPTTTGGEALQQGRAPETLPRTGSAQSYRRAAEEVIREGRIPLEYQEIVRDYFR